MRSELTLDVNPDTSPPDFRFDVLSIERLLTLPSGKDEIKKAIEGGRIEEIFAGLSQIKARRVPVANVDFLRALCFLSLGNPYSALEALKEELRFFPDNREAATQITALGLPEGKPVSDDTEFCELYAVVRPFTMLSEARLYSLYSLARCICEDELPGNFVECGVAAGGSSGLLAAVIKRYGKQPRRLFSFDTFAGLPEPSELDKSNGQAAEALGWGTGTCAAPEASLKQVCEKLGVISLVQPVKGLFCDTLPLWRDRIGPIALLHMDGDWYSSTTDVLENLFDQVVPRGRVQVDDYGYWEGCKRAVTEFEQRRGLSFRMTPIDDTGVWFSR